MGTDRPRCDDAGYADDTVLVAGLRAGEEGAFTWLLDRHDRMLRRLARTFVATQAAADEVVQETWLAVVEGIDRFEQRSSLRTWITRILVNKARSRGVRDKRSVPFSSVAAAAAEEGAGRGPTVPPERLLPADQARWPGHWAAPPPSWDELPPVRLEARETLDRVRDAIDALPPVHRRVITLRDVDGWPADQICALLDLTPAHQRVVLHRARARVRAALEPYLMAVPT